jgi:uncharacterized protein
VTGSAKLDTYRKAGDSLAGRFFGYRLYPFDLKELAGEKYPENKERILEKLLKVGGYPEPFLNGKKDFYNKWKRSHLDVIIKQDLIEMETISSIPAIQTLIELLRSRVGSPVSYSSLARDLQVSDKTVKRWLTILESLFVVFKISPSHANVARAILKAPKYYFYDTAYVAGDDWAKLENLTAMSLLKEIHFKNDAYGKNLELSYVKNKKGNEIDFLITDDKKPKMLIEVKWSDDKPSNSFGIFKFFAGVPKIQVVKELAKEKTYPDGTEIRRADKWLSMLNL